MVTPRYPSQYDNFTDKKDQSDVVYADHINLIQEILKVMERQVIGIYTYNTPLTTRFDRSHDSFGYIVDKFYNSSGEQFKVGDVVVFDAFNERSVKYADSNDDKNGIGVITQQTDSGLLAPVVTHGVVFAKVYANDPISPGDWLGTVEGSNPNFKGYLRKAQSEAQGVVARACSFLAAGQISANFPVYVTAGGGSSAQTGLLDHDHDYSDPGGSGGRLADDSVNTEQIQDSAVTRDKILDAAVDYTKIESNTIKPANIDLTQHFTFNEVTVTTDLNVTQDVNVTQDLKVLGNTELGNAAGDTTTVTGTTNFIGGVVITGSLSFTEGIDDSDVNITADGIGKSLKQAIEDNDIGAGGEWVKEQDVTSITISDTGGKVTLNMDLPGGWTPWDLLDRYFKNKYIEIEYLDGDTHTSHRTTISSSEYTGGQVVAITNLDTSSTSGSLYMLRYYAVTPALTGIIDESNNDNTTLADHMADTSIHTPRADSFRIQETVPDEFVDGVNKIFTVQKTFAPESTRVFYNGMRLSLGATNDYTEELTFNRQVEFTWTPASSSIIVIEYEEKKKRSTYVYNEDHSDAIDGVITQVDTQFKYRANTLEVFYNGQRLTKDIDYTEDADTWGFTLTSPLPASPPDQVLIVDYDTNWGNTNVTTTELGSGTVIDWNVNDAAGIQDHKIHVNALNIDKTLKQAIEDGDIASEWINYPVEPTYVSSNEFFFTDIAAAQEKFTAGRQIRLFEYGDLKNTVIETHVKDKRLDGGGLIIETRDALLTSNLDRVQYSVVNLDAVTSTMILDKTLIDDDISDTANIADQKILIHADGIEKTLEQAIEDGDIGSGGEWSREKKLIGDVSTTTFAVSGDSSSIYYHNRKVQVDSTYHLVDYSYFDGSTTYVTTQTSFSTPISRVYYYAAGANEIGVTGGYGDMTITVSGTKDADVTLSDHIVNTDIHMAASGLVDERVYVTARGYNKYLVDIISDGDLSPYRYGYPITSEVPTQISPTIFQTDKQFIYGKLQVYLNGQRLHEGLAEDYTILDHERFQLTFTLVPSDKIQASYVPLGNSGFNWIFGEIPGGNIDGINTVYTTERVFLSPHVYHNGLRLIEGDDYVLNPTLDGFTMLYTLPPTSKLMVDYEFEDQSYIDARNIAGDLFVREILDLQVTGGNVSFNVNYAYHPGTLEVYLNGILLRENTHYVETTTNEFIFMSPPAASDSIDVKYFRKYTV